MDNSRELERLLRKARKVGKQLRPPTITAVIWDEGAPAPPDPEPKEFQLRIMIEQDRGLK